MIVDRLLDRLVAAGRRRGRGGEPLWAAVSVAAFLVRRARKKGPKVVWSGTLAKGESLTVRTLGPGQAGSPPA